MQDMAIAAIHEHEVEQAFSNPGRGTEVSLSASAQTHRAQLEQIEEMCRGFQAATGEGEQEFVERSADVTPKSSSRRLRWERRQELKEAGGRPVRTRRGAQAAEQREAKTAASKPYARRYPKAPRTPEKKASQPQQSDEPTELEKAHHKYRAEYAARLTEMKRVHKLEQELAAMRGEPNRIQVRAGAMPDIAQLRASTLEMQNALLVQREQLHELTRRRCDSERARRMQVEQDANRLADRNAQLLARLGEVCQSLQQARTENASLRSQLHGGNMRSDPTIPVIAPPPYAPSASEAPPQYAPSTTVAGSSVQA